MNFTFPAAGVTINWTPAFLTAETGGSLMKVWNRAFCKKVI
jgi:hypothetical protein